ncbi:MAG: hypothetical protein GYA24_05340 [Candidatus Lokiarchaeota archaeon]|nr:hypothetical protein [Candidatus Lokiarchaeota archaeon]
MAFDYLFKRIMRDMLPSCDSKSEDVGDLPLRIDAVARCKGDLPTTMMIPLLERSFSKENILEYKSGSDKRRKENLSKLLGYVGLYCDQRDIGIDEMHARLTAWYITAKRPRFLDDLIRSKTVTPADEPGIYDVKVSFPCPTRVVVCDEVAVNDNKIPLLVLGSEETIKTAIRHLARASPELRHDMETIISLIYLFYHDDVKDMTEMNDLLPPKVRESMKHAIEAVGLEEMIEEIGIDKVIEAAGIDKVIEAAGIDKVEATLAKAKANRKPKKSI